VAEAIGQDARFRSVREEYKKAPEVTRKRIYLHIQGGTDKIILDSKGGQTVLPYLSLDHLHEL
jgi:modulator of FtsH protease HflK